MSVDLNKNKSNNDKFELENIDIIISVIKENKGYTTKEIIELLKCNNFNEMQIEESLITLSTILDESMNGTVEIENPVIFKAGKFYLNIPSKEIHSSSKSVEESNLDINNSSNIDLNNTIANEVKETRLNYSKLYMDRNYILRLKKHYIGDTCIQIMKPYDDGITIFSPDKILYHNVTGSNYFINDYLNDDRRYHFPYSNIPTHIRKFKGHKLTYVNQLFDYNKPYITIESGLIREAFVLKNDEEVVVINNNLEPSGIKLNYKMSEIEFYNFLNQKDDNEQLFIMGFGGEFIDLDNLFKMTQSQIRGIIIDDLNDKLNSINGYWLKIFYYNETQPKHFDEFKNYIEKASLKDLIGFSFYVGDSKVCIDSKFNTFLTVKTNGKQIHLDLVELSYIDGNKYNVCIKNIPIYDYVWEQLNSLDFKSCSSKEPPISLRLNPFVTKDDIKEAKKFIKQLKKSNR